METSHTGMRALFSMAAVALMNGGRLAGKKFTMKDHLMFGKKGYSGSARLMLTLPPIPTPVKRSEEWKGRVKANRQKRRARIMARGY